MCVPWPARNVASPISCVRVIHKQNHNYSYVLTPYLPQALVLQLWCHLFYPMAPRFFDVIYGCPLTREEERVGQTDPSISRIQSVVQ